MKPSLTLIILPSSDSLLEEFSTRVSHGSGRRICLREVGMKCSTNVIDHSQFVITREFLI